MTSRRVTIFGKPIARWANEIIKSTRIPTNKINKTTITITTEINNETKNKEKLNNKQHDTNIINPPLCVFTWPQIFQLSLTPLSNYLWNILIPEEELDISLNINVIRAALVHSPRLRKIHKVRGDVLTSVDITSPALSINGIALSEDINVMKMLENISIEKGYNSPFWLTREELEYFVFSYNRLEYNFNCNACHPFRSPGGSETIPSVIIKDNSGNDIQFVNLSEFSKSTLSGEKKINSFYSFYAFRFFIPINVFTKTPFSHDITNAIRRYCMLCGCWCTVWGTPSDFKLLGIEILEGPLGLWVFDAFDFPIFLMNAFSCTDTLAAFSHVYSNEIVSFTNS